MSVAEQDVLARLFTEARTFSSWQERPVDRALVEEAFRMASLGPTSANCEPMRLVLVASPEGKERLLPCVSSGNSEKVRTAPVTAIVAYDLNFFDEFHRLWPHGDAKSWFTSNAGFAEETALRNSSLQGAYFIMALRSKGLDCGPMSGFDPGKVNAAFFPNGKWKANFLMNIGYGMRERLNPRLFRLPFAEVARWE